MVFFLGKMFSIRIFKFVLFSAFLLIQFNSNAQEPETNVVNMPVQLSIPPKASISLAGSGLKFKFDSKKGTEQIITPTSVGKLWINYSSIVEGSNTNSICVNLSTNNLPAEIMIKLIVGSDVGGGFGKMGKPAEPIILTLSPQPIITEIGSCFTGQGMNKGNELTYSWQLAPEYDPDLLKIEELKIEAGVVYTVVSSE